MRISVMLSQHAVVVTVKSDSDFVSLGRCAGCDRLHIWATQGGSVMFFDVSNESAMRFLETSIEDIWSDVAEAVELCAEGMRADAWNRKAMTN